MQTPRKKRVVIIDDEESIRGLLQQFLTIKGCDAIAVATCEEALREIASTPPDLIISDLTLGDSDGLEVVDELKSRHPNLPILLLTGVSFDPAVVRENILSRVDAYLHKTVPLNDIYAEVMRLLERRPAS